MVDISELDRIVYLHIRQVAKLAVDRGWSITQANKAMSAYMKQARKSA